MVPEKTHSPTMRLTRAARIATILCAVCCAVVLPVGVATGVVGGIHLFMATEHPTGRKTAPFKHGNTVLYNTPELLAWRDRLLAIGVTGTALFLVSGGARLLLRRAAVRSKPALEHTGGGYDIAPFRVRGDPPVRKSKRAWPGVALLVAIGGAMCWMFLAAPPVEDQFRQLQACPSSEVTEVRIYDFDSAYSGSSPSFVKRGAETARFLEMIANAERASPNRSRGASTLLFAEVDTKRLGTMYLSMSATEHCGVLVSLRSKGVADHGSYWSTAPFRNDELIAVFSEYAHVRRAARRP